LVQAIAGGLFCENSIALIRYGWGLLDGQKEATFLGDLKDTNKRDLLKEGTYTGTPWTARINSNGSNKDGIKVTLAWTDPAATNLPARTRDNPASVLVNDLNLSLKGPDGTIYRPWVLDPNNPSVAASKGINKYLHKINCIFYY